uniref:Uncharacterized protein n=1 Tax=Arundo donax TaxID=35708 RepID=A0A0A9GZR8_ARUDO
MASARRVQSTHPHFDFGHTPRARAGPQLL